MPWILRRTAPQNDSPRSAASSVIAAQAAIHPGPLMVSPSNHMRGPPNPFPRLREKARMGAPTPHPTTLYTHTRCITSGSPFGIG